MRLGQRDQDARGEVTARWRTRGPGEVPEGREQNPVLRAPAQVAAAIALPGPGLSHWDGTDGGDVSEPIVRARPKPLSRYVGTDCCHGNATNSSRDSRGILERAGEEWGC